MTPSNSQGVSIYCIEFSQLFIIFSLKMLLAFSGLIVKGYWVKRVFLVA